MGALSLVLPCPPSLYTYPQNRTHRGPIIAPQEQNQGRFCSCPSFLPSFFTPHCLERNGLGLRPWPGLIGGCRVPETSPKPSL
jgi:hypothetical protein